MSNEFFQTPCVVDVRTAPNGRDVEYARPGEGYPRWLNEDGTINRPEDGERTWATCYLYAHELLEIAAQALSQQAMTGLTGDHPKKRLQAAILCHEVGEAIKKLAGDAAYDGVITDERWEGLLERIREAAISPAGTSRAPK